MREKSASTKYEIAHTHGGHHARRAHSGAIAKPLPRSRPKNAMRRAALALNGARFGQVVVVAFALITTAIVIAAVERRNASPRFDDGGMDATETEASASVGTG
jgi:hypothetical protein